MQCLEAVSLRRSRSHDVCRHLVEGELVGERPQLEVVLLVARRQLRHLVASVRRDGVRHLHHAPDARRAVRQARRYLQPAPRAAVVLQAPDGRQLATGARPARTARRRRRRLTLAHTQRRHAVVDLHAPVVQTQLAGARQFEVVARNDLVLVAHVRYPDVVVGHRLEARASPQVHDLAVVHGVHRRRRNFRYDRLEVPVEALAGEALAQFVSRLQGGALFGGELDALEVVGARRRVEVLLRVVHPHISDPHQVLLDDHLAVAVELVGEVLEDVADARADDGDDAPATHPRAEAELDVLAAPHAHARVELANPREVLLANGDRAPDESRREVRVAGLESARRLVVRQTQPRVPDAQKGILYCRRTMS